MAMSEMDADIKFFLFRLTNLTSKMENGYDSDVQRKEAKRMAKLRRIWRDEKRKKRDREALKSTRSGSW